MSLPKEEVDVVNIHSFSDLCFLLTKSTVFFSRSVAGIAILIMDQEVLIEKSNGS